MPNFTHLHVHSQYSLLDGATSIKGLVSKAKEYGMTAVALTDHGNMFGAKDFHNVATREGIKPLIGCEAYVARETRFDKEPGNKRHRSGDHLIIIAKNKTGYHNLLKLVSYSWTEGFYYKPRIDKELLKKYKEGLIVSSACLGGEIPQAIMKGKLDDAEKAALEYKEMFGADFYLELTRHKSGNPEKDKEVYDNQELVNKELIKLSEKLDIKYIATNDVHFLNKEDAEAHDTLICISTGKDKDDPTRMRYTRQEFFASPQEMAEIFSDLPNALENTQEIVDKVENYEINSKPIMPVFKIPEEFSNADDYLKHVTYEGAIQRWGEENLEDKKERIDFELETVKKMGFPDYFLIVWDLIKEARNMDVSVGPGRGSAAGSVIAYCLEITNIDPLEYDLLFERFLNPDRISMPDIDIDFDEEGREKVLKWVIKKYGEKRVANIITFGSMLPKMAIRDVARVGQLPLSEADRLAKLVPEKPGMNFEKAYAQAPDLKKERDKGSQLIQETLELAETLNGSIRNKGVHACGIIIGRDDLENYVPLSTAKESNLKVTQFDGSHVEDIGLLKMDFLGLKTLSIIKDAVKNIFYSTGKKIDIDNIPLDDKKTFELYSKGSTTGLFQFESDGMKKHLRSLKPNRFEDLIAMNALYRPGPMEYIPSFINRKHGREKIEYDVPEMKEFLAETYGITVYQEQVMLLSRKLGGFTKGQADSLRKAMGKKKKKLIDELKPKFFEGCAKNNLPIKKVEKIWSDWEAFASYAFNKSHSTCYAYISYQTAYLKAHFPADYMAAVLSRNFKDIKKVSIFMDESKRMGIDVLGPDINESYKHFTVNKKGSIRFGLVAIKGVGEAAVENIIEKRNEDGNFLDVYNFVERVNLSFVTKRVLEPAIYSGAMDNILKHKRIRYFGSVDADTTFIDILLKYGNKMQLDNDSNQNSIFGESADAQIKKPEPPEIKDDWTQLERLNKEKELIGIYLSAHPLDTDKVLINAHCNVELSQLKIPNKWNGNEIKIAGLVTDVQHKTTKTGKPWGNFTLEDFSDTYKINLFSKPYLNFKKYLTPGYKLYVTGKFEPRYNNPSEFQFNIKKINMLSDMKIKSLAIKVPIENLTDDFITDIHQLTEENKGDANLQFLVYEPETKVWLQMASSNSKINVSEDIINYLKEKKEVEYKIF